MSRLLAGLDRFFVGLIGLLLIGVGVLAVVWERALVSWLQPRITDGPVANATSTTWWPWAVGAGGVVLMIIAFRWLFSHLSRTMVGSTVLAESDRTGRLRACD